MFYATGWNTGQVLAVKPDGRGDVTATHVVWRVTRGAPKKPSMLLVGDLLMMINDNGIVTCLDAHTGAEVWTARLTDSYSASPIAAEGRVYFFSEDGKATVIEAGRTFKKLAENTLDEGFMASPAIDGRALFLRTRSYLYRVENVPLLNRHIVANGRDSVMSGPGGTTPQKNKPPIFSGGAVHSLGASVALRPLVAGVGDGEAAVRCAEILM